MPPSVSNQPRCTSTVCLLMAAAINRNYFNLPQIRVLMPGFEQTSEQMPFHPYYLKNIEHYSVIRFMGWQNINGNMDVSWANRTTPAHATRNSAPLEYMIALANQVVC